QLPFKQSPFFFLPITILESFLFHEAGDRTLRTSRRRKQHLHHIPPCGSLNILDYKKLLLPFLVYEMGRGYLGENGLGCSSGGSYMLIAHSCKTYIFNF
ncbi:hypothetical protein LINPERPRIM_LOCUS26448, partial [Linum perenne]